MLIHWLVIMNGVFRWWHPFTYFSVWNLFIWFSVSIFRFVSKRPCLPWYAEVAHLTSMLICSTAGFYFTWVRPRFIYIWYIRLFVDGIWLNAIDLMCHHAPALLVFTQHPQPTDLVLGPTFVVGHVPFFIYLSWQGRAVLELYSLRWEDLLVMSILYTIVLLIWYTHLGILRWSKLKSWLVHSQKDKVPSSPCCLP